MESKNLINMINIALVQNCPNLNNIINNDIIYFKLATKLAVKLIMQHSIYCKWKSKVKQTKPEFIRYVT